MEIKKMTPAERAITALNRGIPDEVPTFELEFQLSQEFFGREMITPEFRRENFSKLSRIEQEKLIDETADFIAHVYNTLDYAIIPAYWPGSSDPSSWVGQRFNKRIREMTGHNRLFGTHGDGTFAIPNGNDMYGFAYRIADDPDAVIEEAQKMANNAIENNKRQKEAGIDVMLLCSDYCYNSGPFISPAMFSDFVAPFLAQIIAAARAEGLYTIKHTDGNIMPILDQMVQCNPHAIHSIDPMAGVDIREVKRLVGDKVCLCGNVHCAAIQTGTEQEVIDSCEYCLKYGKEGGGYIYCTSNVPFKGMPKDRYQLVLDMWKKHRKY